MLFSAKLGQKHDGPVIGRLPTDRCVHRQSDIVGIFDDSPRLKGCVGSTESNVTRNKVRAVSTEQIVCLAGVYGHVVPNQTSTGPL